MVGSVTDSWEYLSSRSVKKAPSDEDKRLSSILHDLFDLDDAEHILKRNYIIDRGLARLSPSSLLCANCLKRFVKLRLWLWWLNEKASGRVRGVGTWTSDCPYVTGMVLMCTLIPIISLGYKCHHQTNTSGHSKAFNVRELSSAGVETCG